MDAPIRRATQRCGLAPGARRVTYGRMNATEQAILGQLTELEASVATMRPPGPRPELRPLLARLGELTRQLPPGTPPELLHYLHKHSYEKARLFLQGRDAENAAGNCGHV